MNWTAQSVPDVAAWDEMATVQQHLTNEDRRVAIGLPARVRP
jgi:hypothetical protein